MSEPQPAEQRLFGDRMLERMPLIWTIVYYASIAISLLWATRDRDDPLRGWELVAAFGLCATSAALFLLVYWPERNWPMRPRQARAYFTLQLLIFAALLALSSSFFGLGFAFMGQTFGALRPRWWATVLVPLLALLAGPLGWAEAVLRAEWASIATFALMIGVWLLAGALLTVLYGQRYRLLELVAELRRARSELEAAAAQQEELAILRERTRLAREMHDSLGHALVAVNVKLEAAQRLYRVDAARGDAELEATRALVRATMGELRRSLADLRAPTGDHHDLPAALRRLAAEVTARGVVAVRVAAPEAQRPPPQVAEALFLIAREALVNVERHARARQAALTLQHDGHSWRIEVADDGIGVRPADLGKPGHFGVVGMRERADALGGHVAITARSEGGTLVAAHIPSTAMVGA
ncbi:MAG: hypothetical protein OHK0015_02430 [Chloroflexi bacterium OHK40]